MNSVLLTAGAACVILAVVGGGAKAFGVEVPVLTGAGRQVVLAVVGVLFLVAAYGLRDTGGGGSAGTGSGGASSAAGHTQDAAVARYRQAVVATCAESAQSGSIGGALLASQNTDGTYDRQRFAVAYREQLAGVEAVWTRLWQRPVPSSLAHDVAAARAATGTLFARADALVRRIPDDLRGRFTDPEVFAWASHVQARLAGPSAHANAALTDLAQGQCLAPGPSTT